MMTQYLYLHSDVKKLNFSMLAFKRIYNFGSKSGFVIAIGIVSPRLKTTCIFCKPFKSVSAPKNLPIDAMLGYDCEIVLAPLITLGSVIHGFSRQDWSAISQVKVFRSKTNIQGEYDYRQSTMALVATSQPTLSLSEIVAYKYVAVCWSQISFPVHHPTPEVLSKITSDGKPTTVMVWSHLQHLPKNLKYNQIQDFLRDLEHTYEYLQENLVESKTSFQFKDKKLWLNLDSYHHNMIRLKDIKSSWYSIGELVLSSSCDAGPIKAVKPCFMGLERLLRTLGCSSITYPTVTRPRINAGSSISSSLRRMRSEDKGLDITYSSEGETIRAHKLVLSAMSEKCASQFSGRWNAEEVIYYDEDEDPDGFLSFHTLSTMIDFAYEDEIDWESMEVCENDGSKQRAAKLQLLLDLCKGAGYWLMPELKSRAEDKILVAGKLLINLENVVDIQRRADEVNAKEVEKMSAQFIQQNRDAVDKAHAAAES